MLMRDVQRRRSNPPGNRLRSNRAFTFVEMTMVIAIIVIIGAIAMPRYASAIARYRALSSAQRIASDIGLVQAAARAASTSRAIVFTYGSPSRYSVANLRDSTTGAATYAVALDAEPYRAQMISAVSTNLAAPTTANSATLTFDGFGVPDGGFTIVVTSGNTTKTVTVEATTGKCTIQ